MAWKYKYRCKECGYEADVYEGRGLFRQQITAMICPDCNTVQNIVVGCGSDNIKIWDMHTCPKCQGEVEPTGEKEFWT